MSLDLVAIYTFKLFASKINKIFYLRLPLRYLLLQIHQTSIVLMHHQLLLLNVMLILGFIQLSNHWGIYTSSAIVYLRCLSSSLSLVILILRCSASFLMSFTLSNFSLISLFILEIFSFREDNSVATLSSACSNFFRSPKRASYSIWSFFSVVSEFLA